MHKKNTNSRILYYDPKTGTKVRFDLKAEEVPDTMERIIIIFIIRFYSGKHDYYLDIDVNPVPKGSKASHILPQEGWK